jgi:arsenate reductase
MNRPKILILCTGNSARSQMAEGLMREHVGDEFEIFSAGLEPKGVNPLAIKAMAEIGLDISHHTSKDVRDFLGKVQFTYLITVCSNAEERCPIFPGVMWRMYWPFEDPAAVEGTEAEKLAAFRQVRDALNAKIQDWNAERIAKREALR